MTMPRKKSVTDDYKSWTKKNKVKKVMGEFKRGSLRAGGSGTKVTSRKQAIAIAISESKKA